MSIRNELLEQILAAIGGGSVEANYYTEAARFTQLSTQNGPALDTLETILLGAGGSDPDGIVTVAANGEITINKSGPLMFKQTFQLAKGGGAGTVEAFFLAEASADNGATWNPLGASINRRITNQRNINVFFDVSPVFLTAGLKVRNRWCQSSVGGDPSDPTVGVDDGSLLYTEPSAALQTAGVQPAPSASAVIYKLNGYNYQ